MEKFINREYSRMCELLEQIGSTSENILQKAERSFQAVTESLAALKEHFKTNEFTGKQEEIRFFKEHKPKFLCELIYYLDLYHIESNKPVADKTAQEAHYRLYLHSIQLFFTQNHVFYNYCRMGKTGQDEDYFVRTPNQAVSVSPEYSLDMDERFSTVYSYKLAKIQAYENLLEYLNRAIHALYHKAETQDEKRQPKLKWTDPKVDLIEWVYAMHAKRSVNNGEANIMQIIRTVEMAFNIDLGNYSAVFNQNIRIRKKNPTAGIDQYKDSLIRYMHELDENPR